MLKNVQYVKIYLLKDAHKINKIIDKPGKNKQKATKMRIRKGKALQLRLSRTPRAAGYKGS